MDNSKTRAISHLCENWAIIAIAKFKNTGSLSLVDKINQYKSLTQVCQKIA